MTQKKFRLYVMLPIGLGCLIMGGLLIAQQVVEPPPPDPYTDAPLEVVDYMMTDRFTEMPRTRQRVYVETMFKRRMRMETKELEAFDRTIAKLRKDDPDRFKQQAQAWWRATVVTAAEQYVELPPEQRDSFLNAQVMVWQAMMRRPDHAPQRAVDEIETREDRQKPMNQRGLDPGKQARIIRFFEEEIFPTTTAKERAMTIIMLRDASHKMDLNNRRPQGQ